MRLVLAALLSLAAARSAYADTVTLRMATIAPEGTAWARELAAFAREIDANTHGAVRVKIYYSSIAGDEFTVINRIKRDQLDGAIGSESCMLLGPSMRVTRIVGLFQTRAESAYVLTRLKPILDAEFAKNGFVNLGQANLGPEILFTRDPVRSVADLRRVRFWVWNLDESLRRQAGALGLTIVPKPIEEAGRAYDSGAVDGFIAIPTAGLAFQWSTRARYLEDLRISYRSGCVFFSSRSFDALPFEAREIIKSAAAKLRGRIEDVGQREDGALLGGLFARQGLKPVPVSERFRTEFFELAQGARVTNKIVANSLLDTVLAWLADYRVMH
jgi:TRAP-type transport system periplasmic protein